MFFFILPLAHPATHSTFFRYRQVPSKEGDGGAGATGNAPAEKKERGKARRERRAAAAAAAVEAEGGDADAAEGSVEVAVGGSVGAYVHISRISDERVEHVDKSYKAGQKVPFARAVWSGAVVLCFVCVYGISCTAVYMSNIYCSLFLAFLKIVG